MFGDTESPPAAGGLGGGVSADGRLVTAAGVGMSVVGGSLTTSTAGARAGGVMAGLDSTGGDVFVTAASETTIGVVEFVTSGGTGFFPMTMSGRLVACTGSGSTGLSGAANFGKAGNGGNSTGQGARFTMALTNFPRLERSTVMNGIRALRCF